jgi:hypothetical protein
LHIWTIGEHTHGSEIWKLGLKLDREAKLLEVVDGSSCGMQEHFHVYVAAADFHSWAVVRPQTLHIKMNQKKDTEISPTKQNVSAFQYLVKRARTEKVHRALGGNANTFEGFKEIMEKHLLSAKVRTHLEEQGAHL